MDESRGTNDDLLKIEYVRLDGIKMPLRNPKGHSLQEIGDSIGRFGYISPAVVNERTGRLVAGKGRYDALVGRKVSGKRVPARIKVAEDGMWMMPVIKVDFETDAEAEAYLIADNRLTELGGMEDEPMLLDMLTDLATEGEEMLKGIGYDGEDIDELWRRLKGEDDSGETKEEAKERVGDKEEDVAKLLEKWGVKEGDVWMVEGKAGVHAIICGDCRDDICWKNGLKVVYGKSVLSRINGIVTSPPYAEQRKRQYGGIPVSEYVKWWQEVQLRAGAYIENDGSFFLNIKASVVEGERSTYVMKLVTAMKEEWGWAFIDEFCWLRPPFPGEVTRHFKNGYEQVYQFAKHASKPGDESKAGFKFRPEAVMIPSDAVPEIKFEGGKKGSDMTQYQGRDGWILGDQKYTSGLAYPSNVLKAWVNDKVRGQEASFPVELPEFFIKAYSDEGDVWCDPFLGSGTTIVACERNGRIGIGIEKEPKYVAIALERLELEEGCVPRRI